LLFGGVIKNLLPEANANILTNMFEAIHIPFLLWCMHPLTLGAKILKKLVETHDHQLLKGEKKGLLTQLFNLVIGCAFI